MPLQPANNIEVLDEGVSQGRVRSMDFAGASVTAAVVGSRATITVSAGGGGMTYQQALAVVSLRM